MSVTWLAPAALAGLAMVAGPIAIHLLTRQQARTQPFPSLRFLLPTQLSALRRRHIQDVVLLACRVLIVALAALALAAPVIQSPSRSAAHAARLSRAVVSIGPASADQAPDLQAGVFRFAAFHRAVLADAIVDAINWLNVQPASAREVVFAGRLHRGDVDASDLQLIPDDIGVHFAATRTPAPIDVTIAVLAHREEALVRIDRLTHLASDATQVTKEETRGVPPDLVSILAGNQAVASAALNAVLDVGVPWRDFDRKVVVVWEDANAAAAAKAQASGALLIPMAVPQPPAASADALMRVLRGVSPPEAIDPVEIADARLNAWTRLPGPPSSTAPLADEGDRRGLWVGALVLLVIEWRLRQSRAIVNNAGATAESGVRVA